MMTATPSPSRKSFLQALGASAVLTSLAACGGSQVEDMETATATTEAPSDGGGATSEAEPQPVDAIDYSQNDQFGIVLSDEVRSDPFGEYHQLTLSPDSPLLDLDASLVEESVFYEFSEEEVVSGLAVVAPFTIEQIDSTLLWDDSEEAKQAWLDANMPRFTNVYHPNVERTIMEPDGAGYLITSGDANQWKSKYFHPLYEAGTPRLAFSKVNLISVTGFMDNELDVPSLRFDFEFVSQEDVFEIESSRSGAMCTGGRRAYVVQRDTVDDWIFSGWSETLVRSPVAVEKYDPAGVNQMMIEKLHAREAEIESEEGSDE